MKFLLFNAYLAFVATSACAGPGSSKTRMFTDELACFARKITMQKRFCHTQKKTKGFRPEKQIVDENTRWHTFEWWPKNLEYIDEARETFKAPPGFSEMLARSVREIHNEPSEPKKKEKK